ncbi:carbon-nitrogen hydrolase family protein [Kribbella shirazensis]|uniref:Nitrilase/aliphatic nitrilase n=1 Tax=Kribbella shirazensis TaxID=1105143 RepID=A0A7X6A5Q0_9ACTN|nr:carbon-nitrogen hydrolase family protein [Kribbella shirazensis]NIK61519.1 nitrilase/aliphatic nitrilase [Kribbella shirazensis]
MTTQHLPRIKVAAVQAAPVFLDRDATIDKLAGLVAEAAGQGAELVVLGETFLAGFPIWNGVLPPVDQHDLHHRLFESAITVPGPYVDVLGSIAAQHGVVLSVGVNERAAHSLGQLFNANLIFDSSGRLVNHRRKLVATWYERLTWSHGDAHDLKPVELGGWNLGALICGENTNTLARYALLAQGERLHIATYPPAWPFDQRPDRPEYDLLDSIRLRSAAHTFEGKVFSVVAATALDDQAVAEVAGDNARVADMLRSTPTASLVVGPRGETLAGPLVGEEGILYADIDLSEEITLKQAHDIVGTYQRLDLFEVRMDTRRPTPLAIDQTAEQFTDARQLLDTEVVLDV